VLSTGNRCKSVPARVFVLSQCTQYSLIITTDRVGKLYFISVVCRLYCLSSSLFRWHGLCDWINIYGGYNGAEGVFPVSNSAALMFSLLFLLMAGCLKMCGSEYMSQKVSEVWPHSRRWWQGDGISFQCSWHHTALH
jgi:hypothetical protein